jgi:cell division septation protein DedD
LAQDDYFYEIQLTNKQLVFYFMAGATGLILSFLAGVMVGRGVDQGAAEVQAARPVQDERIVSEETPRPAPSAQELTYAQRLEGERTEERLERVKPSPAALTRPSPSPSPSPKMAAVVPSPAGTAPRTAPASAPPPAAAARPAAGGAFALQVGAFKDRATAESMVARLKGKGFAAYLVTPQEGLFNVRVGGFATRAEAEKAQEQLRGQKLDPFVVKQ